MPGSKPAMDNWNDGDVDKDVVSLPSHRVRFVDLPAQYEEEKEQIHAAVDRVFSGGRFFGGEPVAAFEKSAAKLAGTDHAVAVGSGTMALLLSMKTLGIGPGDKVILPANSYFSSASTIVELGAVPVFADVAPDQNIDPAVIEALITPGVKAVMAVHLTGRIADMDAILDIANRHGLLVIEDAAQAIGASYRGRPAGQFGDAAAFSAHPLKNLNAAGDAGFITTNDGGVADALRRLRNHGLADRDTVSEWGFSGRIDALNAEILNTRISGLPGIIKKRRANAFRYRELLDEGHVFCPPCKSHEYNSFHLFVVQVDRRDDLQAYLARRGISSAIHYRIPLHLQPAAKSLGYKPGDMPKAEHQAGRILSLPVHQYLEEDDIHFVAGAINDFYHR